MAQYLPITRGSFVSHWQVAGSYHSGQCAGCEAHTLASTCRSFGLPAVADRLKLIEAHAKSAPDEAPPDLEHTGAELTAGLLELKSVIAGLSGTP